MFNTLQNFTLFGTKGSMELQAINTACVYAFQSLPTQDSLPPDKLNPEDYFEDEPVLKTQEGLISGARAILRYFGRMDTSGKLYGKTHFVMGQVDQWLDWNTNNLKPILKSYVAHYIPEEGRDIPDENLLKFDRDELMIRLNLVERHLLKSPFFASETLTLADIDLVTTFSIPFNQIWDAEFRKQIPKLTE